MKSCIKMFDIVLGAPQEFCFMYKTPGFELMLFSSLIPCVRKVFYI